MDDAEREKVAVELDVDDVVPLLVAKDDTEAVTVGVVETLAVEVAVDDPDTVKVPLIDPEGVSCSEIIAVLVGDAVFEELTVEVIEIKADAELHVDTVPVTEEVLHDDKDDVDEEVGQLVMDDVADDVRDPD